jgi:hypothetical protein
MALVVPLMLVLPGLAVLVGVGVVVASIGAIVCAQLSGITGDDLGLIAGVVVVPCVLVGLFGGQILGMTTGPRTHGTVVRVDHLYTVNKHHRLSWYWECEIQEQSGAVAHIRIGSETEVSPGSAVEVVHPSGVLTAPVLSYQVHGKIVRDLMIIIFTVVAALGLLWAAAGMKPIPLPVIEESSPRLPAQAPRRRRRHKLRKHKYAK